MEVEAALYSALAESRGGTLDGVRAAVGGGGDIDSLEGVELVAAAEARFGITIADEELSPRVCSSIPRLADLVVSKMSPGTAGGG
jgi:acyl carrier protein